nr:FMN-binding negative transcriptional regulator [uncultured Dongia sp.]
MYVPEHFDESRVEVLHELIDKNALGVLFTHGKSGLDANHLPFHLNKTQGQFGTLQCHVARRNPLWQDIATGDEVLVVFRAADAYISPNWYPTKHETGKQVPTWNYMVAHAYGRATIHDDERYVRAIVAHLTRKHEAAQPQPWKMADSPRDYIDTLAKAIVGIEIQITRLVGKSKLGQDEVLRDAAGAGKALEQRGDAMIGEAMLAVAASKSDRI